MNSFERSLIEEAGYANGWENVRESVRESVPERVVMFSARHKAEALVTPTAAPIIWQVTFPQGPSVTELARSLPELAQAKGTFTADGEAVLGRLLRRASRRCVA
jgi:hypothetical protein